MRHCWQSYRYLRDRLSLQWRRFTHRFVDNYFRDRAYYNLNTLNTDIDNPISASPKMSAVYPRITDLLLWSGCR